MLTCNDCIHSSVCTPYNTPNDEYPNIGDCPHFKNKSDYVEVVKPKTNFDLINAMRVEELARFLAEHIDHYRAPYDVKEIYANAIDNKTGKGVIWIEAFKRWLESEVDPK